MPRYWILCMSEDNYLIAKEQGLLGFSEKAKTITHQLGIGDMITFYISRKRINDSSGNPAQQVQEFRGTARITGEAFFSEDLIWHARQDEIFPHRMPAEFLSDRKVIAKPIAQKLSYVTKPVLWALPFRRGHVEIRHEDFAIIQTAMGQTGSEPCLHQWGMKPARS